MKHVASMDAEYFGLVFDRPFPEPLPWLAPEADPNADMWATAEESRDDIVGLYHRAWAHSDATIEALPLEATGTVPWWSSNGKEVTLHWILVHMIAETHRHAGHADLVRELVDGATGWLPNSSNLPPANEGWWQQYRDRLEETAATFRPDAEG